MTFCKEVAPGVEIRQFQMAEAAAIFSLVEKNRAYLRKWLPWVDQTLSIVDVQAFLERATRQFVERRGPSAGVWFNGELCGTIGCHPIDWANRNCSIGYWLDADHQGKGLMTRCCAVLLDYLFDELFLHRVTIRCGTGNTLSCAIPARLGFQREGVMREAEWVNDRWIDLIVWGMLDHDWRNAAVSRSRVPQPG
jgi:ribosomal-protein-serine acetyltransferase